LFPLSIIILLKIIFILQKFLSIKTIINRYSSIFPINTYNSFQCDIEHAKRALDPSNILNPIFRSPNSFNTKCKILNPTPLNIVFPHQDSIDRQYLDMNSLLSKHNCGSQGGRSLKKVFKPTNLFEKPTYYIDSEEDEKNDEDQYDGRTHSLPYEKYGPYTCSKCKGVFNTSQSFAAHMVFYYNRERTKEREHRLRAKNKKRYRNYMENLRRSKLKWDPY